MPELPEVETVRRRLEPVLVGRRFERVEIDDPRLTRPEDPAEVAAELDGRARRGGRAARQVPGSPVRERSRSPDPPPDDGDLAARAGRERSAEVPHRRAVVKLDDGSDVVYRDVRRFGTWLLVEPDELDPYLGARLGGEPLERRSRRSRSPRASRTAGRR